jgi:hypothetical protein
MMKKLGFLFPLCIVSAAVPAQAAEQWYLVVGKDTPMFAVPVQTEQLCINAGIKLKSGKGGAQGFSGRHLDVECIKVAD